MNLKKSQKPYVYFDQYIFYLVDCVWGEYGEWSSCSEACGGGEKSRSRSILTPKLNGGNDCEGNSTQINACNEQPCPIDCEWGSYGDWTECSEDCGGGNKTRSRSKTALESNGGKECEGNATEIVTCNEDSCPGIYVLLFQLFDMETHSLSCHLCTIFLNSV